MHKNTIEKYRNTGNLIKRTMKKYKQDNIKTKRLETAYYHAGKKGAKKLLLLHGNLSSALFFLPLFPYLENDYEIIAPDLRCFGNTEALPVDARRGYRDWSDDVCSFVEEIGWSSFYLAGWSMGGNIAMQFAIDHEKMVKKLILIAPGSPYGFGGTRDEKGTPYEPCGLGSGGGSANPTLTMAQQMGSRFVLRDILNRYYFKPPFRMNLEWENLFIDSIAGIRIGNDYYPGDYRMSSSWPYVVAGDRGVLNTMSPEHGNLSGFLDMKRKPEVLWIRGEDDLIVSDTSVMEFGYLGSVGIIPGWPGKEIYPPQPMVSQLKYFFDLYRKNGGLFVEAVLPGGHMCILESPVHFISALHSFIK